MIQHPVPADHAEGRISDGNCPNCDYCLFGQPRVGTCPECGTAYASQPCDVDAALKTFERSMPRRCRLWRQPSRENLDVTGEAILSLVLVASALAAAYPLASLAATRLGVALIPSCEGINAVNAFAEYGSYWTNRPVRPHWRFYFPMFAWIIAGQLAFAWLFAGLYGSAARRLGAEGHVLRKLGLRAALTAPMFLLVPMGLALLWQIANVRFSRSITFPFVDTQSFSGSWYLRWLGFPLDMVRFGRVLIAVLVCTWVGLRAYFIHRRAIREVSYALGQVQCIPVAKAIVEHPPVAQPSPYE